MLIDPGLLDRRIRIQRPSLVDDEYGDPVEGYSLLAAVWSAVKPGPGRERLASAQNAADAVTVFLIRWSATVADVNPKDRIEYPIASGRFYNIVSVFEVGRREGIEIAAIVATDG